MSNIDRIVDVTITRQTAVPSIPSFSDPIIVAEFLTTDVDPVYGADERVRAFNSLSGIGEAFGTGTDVYRAAAAMLSQNPAVGTVYIGRKLTGIDGDESWTEALVAVAAENNAWYGLIAATRTLADQQMVADWTEANNKLFVTATDSKAATADMLEYASVNTLDRTAVIYHSTADLTADDDWADAAWLGKMFPKDPGTANWAFKSLATVAADDLSGAEQATIEGVNGNYYISVAGISVTRLGTVGSGEYLDIIRGIDWLEARIQQEVFGDLQRNDKVAFTDAGVQVVLSALRSVLQEAQDAGLLASYTATAPEVADVSVTDKGNRLLPDVNFTGVLAGAINVVEINGTVSL